MLFIINLIPALYSNTHTARVRYGRPFFFLAMSLTTHHKIPSHTARPTQKRNNNGRWYEWPFIFSTPCDSHGRVHFMQHRVRHATRPPFLPPGPLSSHQPRNPSSYVHPETIVLSPIHSSCHFCLASTISITAATTTLHSFVIHFSGPTDPVYSIRLNLAIATFNLYNKKRTMQHQNGHQRHRSHTTSGLFYGVYIK